MVQLSKKEDRFTLENIKKAIVFCMDNNLIHPKTAKRLMRTDPKKLIRDALVFQEMAENPRPKKEKTEEGKDKDVAE